MPGDMVAPNCATHAEASKLKVRCQSFGMKTPIGPAYDGLEEMRPGLGFFNRRFLYSYGIKSAAKIGPSTSRFG